MLFYVLILFGLYGWIEFEALILIGNEIGGLASFLGIFVTAFIGMWLLRTQGRAVMARWQSNLHKGEMETDSLASGLSLLLGGFLMLLPGYVTDAIGILCFVSKNSGSSKSSLSGTIIFSLLAISIPTVSFPGIGAKMFILSAFVAKAMLSSSAVILFSLSPLLG